MSIIQQVSEKIRRSTLRAKRAQVRDGAVKYAANKKMRFHALVSLNIMVTGSRIDDLKLMLRSQVQAKAAGHWMYSRSRHIAILQCLGGEMIWLDEQPARRALRAQNEDTAIKA